MRRFAIRTTALLAVAFCAGGCLFRGCGSPSPQPDTCAPGSAAPVDALELGAGEDGPFQPIATGSVVHPVYGGQGAIMVLFRLRARGASVPACMQQRTTVADSSGQVVARSDAALMTEPDASLPNARATELIYLPGALPPAGSLIVVTATAGGQTATGTFTLGAVGNFPEPPDLADAGVSDLADAAIDGSFSD